MPLKYKGTPTPLGDIPCGTPVELISTEVFNTDYRPLLPSIGILKAKTETQIGAQWVHYYEWKDGAFRDYDIKSAGFNSYHWTGDEGMPLDTVAFSVLTGTKGRELQSAYLSQGRTELPNVKDHLTMNGCDPEIFVVDGAGKVIPAWMFLPAKEEAVTVSAPSPTSGYISAYWDGFQAEFTNSPALCASWVVDRLRLGLMTILEAARKIDPSAQLSLDSTVRIPPAIMEAAETKHTDLGCMPSLNVYGASGDIVGDPRSLPFRFAGGHIHLGYKYTNRSAVVRALDAIVGIASVGMFAAMDNPLRRRFYGLAGEHRLPPHGIEYRTLSNAWLCHPAIAFWMFDMCRGVAKLAELGLEKLIAGTPEEIQRIINECDIPAARALAEVNRGIYEALGRNYYGVTKSSSAIMAMIAGGVEAVLPTPRDLDANWMLSTGAQVYSAAHPAKDQTRWKSHAATYGKTFVEVCEIFNKRGRYPALALAEGA